MNELDYGTFATKTSNEVIKRVMLTHMDQLMSSLAAQWNLKAYPSSVFVDE